MYNISVFKIKELYSLCRNVQDIDQGMCKDDNPEESDHLSSVACTVI